MCVPGRMTSKAPFDIDLVMERLEETVRPLPKAVLFELADDGFASVFEQLIACLITVRTREEVSAVVVRRLFARARTPAEIADLPLGEIEALISPATFQEPKARQIQAIARRTMAEFGGDLPCDESVLLSFDGIGPKCTALTLGIACGQAKIGVDIHVHRVTNRWGYVSARTPEQTMLALERVLPERYWLTINRLLVPFGKYVCTGVAPKCSGCPVLAMCRQVGVTSHR